MTSAGTPYQALDLGAGFGGGVVECGPKRALWLPYVEVARVFLAGGPLASTHSRLVGPAYANGQIALCVHYVGWPGQPPTLQVLQLLRLDLNGRIAEITAFVGTELAPFARHASS